VFDLSDAHTIKAFADQTAYVCSLHYWSINDDSAKPRKRRAATQPTTQVAAPKAEPWAFAKIFLPFTTQ
jgi:hypothetical protein